MIKNKASLLKGLNKTTTISRKILLDIADYTLENIIPEKLLKKAITKTTLVNLKKFKTVSVFSIGKAAKSMSKAMDKILKGIIHKNYFANEGHPLPTKEGIKKTQKIISAAKKLTNKDLAIVLISGGGSAMLVAPVKEITLEDKIKTTKDLLRCGAKIDEINTIRKHLSLIKGGQLAKLLYPAKVLGFVISDVVGNDLSVIASGPLSPDKTTFSDALKIVKKYKINLPKNVKKYFQKGQKDKLLETPKKTEKYFKNIEIKIIADHKTALKTAIEKAKKMGLKTISIKKEIEGEAIIEAKKLTSQINSKSTKTILIACGETTVTCKGNGAGGRNQEFVLSGLRFLKKSQTLLSIGTDGVDGICPEKIAGAIADIETLKIAKQKNLKINKFLDNNDSYSFFKKTNNLIKTGETGTNLGDLIMLMDS